MKIRPTAKKSVPLFFLLLIMFWVGEALLNLKFEEEAEAGGRGYVTFSL